MALVSFTRVAPMSDEREREREWGREGGRKGKRERGRERERKGEERERVEWGVKSARKKVRANECTMYVYEKERK